MDRARPALSATAVGVYAALVAGLVAPVSPHAHEEGAPKRDTLTIDPDRVTIVIVYDVPRGDVARALRALFDVDHAAGLDEAERDRLAVHLAHEATAFLGLRIDGAKILLTTRGRILECSGRDDDGLALRLELGGALSLSPGLHAVRFVDWHKDRRIAVPVRLAFGPRTSSASALPPLPLVDEARPLELTIVVGGR